MPHRLDSIDRRIVDELRRDGRLTVNALAERVGLSPSPCLRRLRRLERDGVITGYRAVVDPTAIDRGLTVWVTARLSSHDVAAVGSFEQGITGLDEVTGVFHVTGDVDYLLRIEVPDLAAYDRVLREVLPAVAGGAHLTSYVVTSVLADDHP